VVAAGCVLREGDRVDLLRPLTADPKEARRRRARAARKA
jgi:putative ubiquitin-RnfH superfamily antitoxin RatB of RatAB toxin-antitoxin module